MPEKDISLKDIMNQMQGVITKMDEGFSKNQTSLDALTKEVGDLTTSLTSAHSLISDLQAEMKNKK
jgi:cell division protein FtsL